MLTELDPKLGPMFLKLEKLGMELEEKLDVLEGKSKKEIIVALKKDARHLLKLQLEFEKVMIQAEAKEEIKELDDELKRLDELTEELLNDLLGDEDDGDEEDDDEMN